MISYDEARQRILEHAPLLGRVRRSLGQLLGMVLAEPVVAPFDLPRFNNSAVDGYGVRVAEIEGASEENPRSLRLSGTIKAGDDGKVRLMPERTLRIMTGAPVPADVEAVVMQEFCRDEDGMITFTREARPGENIRRQGEEYQKGQVVIDEGTVITPPVIGLLANLGYASVLTFRRPRVSLITTGNELVVPGKLLEPGQIYDSNSYALEAALRLLHLDPIGHQRAKDSLESTQEAFTKALEDNDVVISLGGISVGDYDFVKDVAEAMGVETIFWKIAIKPGKPVYFGRIGAKLVFGLPGNPVSALVTYHQLVQPALLKMMGYLQPHARRLRAELETPLHKKPGRQEFVRGLARFEGERLRVTPTTGQDSHMLGGLVTANCLIDFPAELDTLPAGALVDVDWLSWNR